MASSFLRLTGGFLLNAVASAALRVRPSPRMSMGSLGGPEIAVLGGGFGGLYTALRLRSLDWSGGAPPRVTLVDRSARFAFSPMLYELAVGTATCWEVGPLYEELLEGTGIDFVRAEVVGLDEARRVVRLEEAREASSASKERQLPFDHCVLAFGLRPAIELVPGAAEHATPFTTVDDALRLKQQIGQLKQRVDEMRRAAAAGGPAAGAADAPVRVGVVGGGYVGVEIAANLASSFERDDASSARGASEAVGAEISVIHRSERLLPSAASDFSRTEAERRLKAAGVDVRACMPSGRPPCIPRNHIYIHVRVDVHVHVHAYAHAHAQVTCDMQHAHAHVACPRRVRAGCPCSVGPTSRPLISPGATQP